MSEHHEPLGSDIGALEALMCDLSQGARRRAVEQGAMLHDIAQPAREVFYITKGQVRRYQLSPDGTRRLLDILGPGDWFGAEALGGAQRYGCQAQAATDSVLCVVAAERILASLSSNPRASVEIIRALARQGSEARQEAGELAFDDCRRRLLKAILKFSHSAAANATPDGVMLRMTHGQLAEAVGAARETVSLMLTQLREANLVKTGRNRLMFSPEAILAVLNFDA